MGARWYDAQLGRWISADSIIPDNSNPQDWNRYTYVRNNPLRFVDPSGHFIQCDNQGNCSDDGYSISNPEFTSWDAEERRDRLLAYKNNLLEWVEKGYTYDGETITDLLAFAELCDYAASMIPQTNSPFRNRAAAFVNDMSSAMHEGLWYLVKRNAGFGGTPNPRYDPNNDFRQSGFDPIFQDPEGPGNQPHHFWFYVHFSYQQGSAAAIWNFHHDGVWQNHHPSYQDFALGQEGYQLGRAIRFGDVDINEVGNHIRRTLSPSSAEAREWSDPHAIKTYASAITIYRGVGYTYFGQAGTLRP